jgi:hypothetical protein
VLCLGANLPAEDIAVAVRQSLARARLEHHISAGRSPPGTGAQAPQATGSGRGRHFGRRKSCFGMRERAG